MPDQPDPEAVATLRRLFDSLAAGARTKYGKKLLDQAMYELAEERLQKIVKEWPNTKAAADARELLKKLDQG
jgi:hypothetical protein